MIRLHTDPRTSFAAVLENAAITNASVHARTAALACAVVLALGVFAGCGGGKAEYPSGTLEAIEVDLAPAIAGRVLDVRHDLGERVAPGDTLLVLDTELVALQRRQSVAALASVEAQSAVAADERQAAERSLALAESTLRRVRSLSEGGSATQQQLDDASAARDLAASAASAARHKLAVFEAERERIAATIAVAERQLKDGVLIAPSAGTVLVRAVEPGEMASPQALAMRIADLTRLELRIYLEPASLGRVRLGQEVPIHVDALGGERVMGRVEWISDEAEFTPKNAQTRDARAQLVYAVKLEVANPAGRLHIGMTADAEI